MTRKEPQQPITGQPPLAIIYARVSTKDQEKEGYSIPAQLHLLREYAQAHQLAIQQEFIDVETAKTTGRTGFNQMLHHLTRPREHCRTLLVEKTDRLYRNLKDWVSIDDLHLEIHFVKENFVLTRDSRSAEKLTHGLKVLLAKNYIDNLGEEASKGMKEKARQGLWPSYAPLGYKNVTAPDGKRIIEPDPDIAPIITKLFDWYATGNYSLKALATLAREQGLSFRKSKQKIPQNTLHKILRKKIYTGDFDFNGTTYHGTHQPLVTRQTWDRVQMILDHRHRNKHRKVKHDFLFQGLVTCGHCRCSLVGEKKKQRYTYYHCTGYRGKCHEPYTREETLTQHTLRIIRDLIIPQELLTWLQHVIIQTEQDDRTTREHITRRLQADYDRLQQRLDAMYLDKLDGRITTAFYDEKARAWRNEQERVQQSIAEQTAGRAAAMTTGLHFIEETSHLCRLFEQQPPAEQRKLLTLIIKEATWRDGTLALTMTEPFEALRVSNHERTNGNNPVGGEKEDLENWLGGRDSNPDTQIQSLQSYRWTTSQLSAGLHTPIRQGAFGADKGLFFNTSTRN